MEEKEELREIARQLFNEGVKAKSSNREYLKRIAELKAELAQMTRQNNEAQEGFNRVMADNARLQAELADWRNSAEIAECEQCTLNNKHCSCVPILRTTIAFLHQHITRLRECLKRLIDAHNNDADMDIYDRLIIEAAAELKEWR
jgi:hypothetical protein